MSTLNEIATQVDSIKTDILNCDIRLSAILVEKGVNVLVGDKLGNKIEKVNDIVVEKHNIPDWHGRDYWISAINGPLSGGYGKPAINNDIAYFPNGSTLECYNTTTNTWSKITLTVSISTILGNIGKIFYCIKSDGNYISYDISNNNIRTLTNKPNTEPYTYALVGRKIYCTTQQKTLHECYDIDTNTWTTKNNAPSTSAQKVFCAVGENLYLVSGYNNPLFFLYDTKADTWTQKSNLPSWRYSIAVSADKNNNVYIMGGWLSSGVNGCVDNLCYTQITDTWTRKANLLTSRYGLTSYVTDKNIIYLIGGISSNGGATYSSNECYII